MEIEHRKQTWEKTVRQLQLALLLLMVFGTGVFFGTQYTTSLAQNNRFDIPDEAEEAFQALYETYNLIQEQYIDDVDATVLVDGAIRGMVEALDDQYSGYVDAQNFPFVDDNLAGEIEGIGVVISENEETGEVEVVNVLKGTPAASTGVKEGDVFVIVDGEDALGLTYIELASRVRGPAGTIVNITMRRGEEMIDFAIERARIEVPNIEWEILEGNIGYMSMAQFTAISREQVDAALEEMDVNSREGLIFDLRGNPGGYLTTATEIAALFIKEGDILIEEFGDGSKHTFVVKDGTVYEQFDSGQERVYSDNALYGGISVPIVVLVDERSASASELVAGAWQDNDSVTILGTTTFGKGTVQIQNTLVNGGGVRLTIARWLTPNGNWISETGITPDIVIELPEDVELEEGEDPQLDAALEFLLTGAIETPEITEMQVE